MMEIICINKKHTILYALRWGIFLKTELLGLTKYLRDTERIISPAAPVTR